MTVVVGVDGFPPSRTALRLVTQDPRGHADYHAVIPVQRGGGGIMIIGGLVELAFGVKAAGKPLEQVAAPLSEIDS